MNKTLYIELCHDDAQVPTIKTAGSAGYDLFSVDNGIIPGHSHTLVKTGVKMVIPNGYCGQIWSRSGLSYKHGIETGAGIIDSDYRGEIGDILHNHTDKEFVYEKGMRIAQILIIPIITPVLKMTDDINKYNISDDNRGDGGFGSTGNF